MLASKQPYQMDFAPDLFAYLAKFL